ncbi:metallophosphoesterase [Spirosoma fluminis]
MKPYLYCLLSYFVFFSSISHGQAPKITRGPYLQVVTPTSVIVRWRTDQPTDSRVTYGTQSGQFTQQATLTQSTTEHQVTLTGLQPATTYYYSIGSTAAVLASDATQYVRTAPATGSTTPLRIWALGDFGDGSANARNVYQAYRNATAAHPADLWLWLGDNAYCCGTDDQFQQYVFNVYGPTLRNLPIFMTPGNHDYADNSNNFDIAYYKLFSMPTKGEAGGVASGSQSYFSADYGNVHLVSLDSQGNEAGQYRLYDTTGTQVQWLKRDLAANKLPWTIVIFHHPPYSKGGHNSDTEESMRLIRQNLTPILERYNVDLVLNGHSHNYERYYRLNGQTGLANTFDKTKHVTENTTARYDGSPGSCPILTKGQGTVYVVNGSGGALGGLSPDYPHPAMVVGYTPTGGSMLLDVLDNRLDAQFIAADGSVQDRFTMMKNVNKTTTLTTEFADTLQLTASWPTGPDSPGGYSWTTGSTNRSIRYVGALPGKFTINVADTRQCLTDQFVVTVQQQPKITALAPASACAGSTIAVTATPENTTKATGWQYDVLLSDASGNFSKEQIIGSGALNALNATLPTALAPGTGYRLRVRPRGIAYAELVSSGQFVVSSAPTATLSGSTTVLQGQPASLTLSFTGEGPWRGTLSDGTAFSAVTSVATFTVSPSQSTTLGVTSLEGSCGKGTGTGLAAVTVLLPTETETFAGGQLRIYPNPTHETVRVDISLTQKKEVTLALQDAQGRQVFHKFVGAVLSVTESIVMPAPAGTYLLRIQIGSETLTRKVVHQ